MSASSTIASRTGGFELNRARVLGIFNLLLAAVILFVFVPAADGQRARFGLNLLSGRAIEVPDLVLPVGPALLVLGVAAAFLGGVQLARGSVARANVILGAVVAIFLLAFLTWAARGSSLNLVGMLQSTVLRATPLALGALSGVLCERAGVINIAIEGQFLVAAFAGAVVGSATNSWVGLLAGVLAGGVIGVILAVLTIRYRADQIIVGVVLDLFALGLTSFLTVQLLRENPHLNAPRIFQPIPIPGLSEIPVLGPIVFEQSVFVYSLFALVALLHWGLFHTRWGLRVRAVGEHPRAADTVGINVYATRYRNVILGGLVAGLGGAYFTIGSVGSFGENMTGGRGFIALAAMIVGRYNPVGALLAGLLFGFSDALQSSVAILRVPIPSSVLLMTPYVVTIVVVAGLVGRVRIPAADGQPYVKE